MFKKYTSLLIIGFFTINVLSAITIQEIYNFDQHGTFDQPRLISSEQVSEYISVVEQDIQNNQVLLESTKPSWLANIAQKVAAVSLAGLGSYGYYGLTAPKPPLQVEPSEFWYRDLEEELFYKKVPLVALDILQNYIKKGYDVPDELWNKMNSRMQDSLYDMRWFKMKDQKEIDKKIKIFKEVELESKKRVADIESYFAETETYSNNLFRYEKIRNIARFAGPMAILSGLALLGYSLYRAHTINNQRNRALDAIDKDKKILEKLRNLI